MKLFLYSAAVLLFLVSAGWLFTKQDGHGVFVMVICAVAMAALYLADCYSDKRN